MEQIKLEVQDGLIAINAPEDVNKPYQLLVKTARGVVIMELDPFEVYDLIDMLADYGF